MRHLAAEVAAVVRNILETLQPIVEKHPERLVSNIEFNQLLGLAREAFPSSRTIQGMSEFAKHPQALDLVIRLSVLRGATATGGTEPQH